MSYLPLNHHSYIFTLYSLFSLYTSLPFTLLSSYSLSFLPLQTLHPGSFPHPMRQSSRETPDKVFAILNRLAPNRPGPACTPVFSALRVSPPFFPPPPISPPVPSTARSAPVLEHLCCWWPPHNNPALLALFKRRVANAPGQFGYSYPGGKE